MKLLHRSCRFHFKINSSNDRRLRWVRCIYFSCRTFFICNSQSMKSKARPINSNIFNLCQNHSSVWSQPYGRISSHNSLNFIEIVIIIVMRWLAHTAQIKPALSAVEIVVFLNVTKIYRFLVPTYGLRSVRKWSTFHTQDQLNMCIVWITWMGNHGTLDLMFQKIITKSVGGSEIVFSRPHLLCQQINSGTLHWKVLNP